MVWFVGVIPFFWLFGTRFWKCFFLGCLLTAMYHQFPFWRNELIRNQNLPNRSRAEALRLASQNPEFRNCTIAEAYPVFSVAFCNRVKKSFEYQVAWDAKDRLRAEGGKGPVVDYVLLEQPPSNHRFHDVAFLDRILRLHGEPIAKYRGYSVWKVNPVRVSVTDGPDSTEDLCLRTDHLFPKNRQLVVRWDLGKHDFKDFHIWIAVDGQEKRYLGRSNGGLANYFIWQAEEYWVDPPFQNGPELGHEYEFILYGIPQNHPVGKPVPYFTKGPVVYR
jgi:hypothetical protein